VVHDVLKECDVLIFKGNAAQEEWSVQQDMINVKYLRDITRVRQNTTLYYDVMCHRTDNMFRPFTIRPSSGLTSRAKEEIVKL